MIRLFGACCSSGRRMSNRFLFAYLFLMGVQICFLFIGGGRGVSVRLKGQLSSLPTPICEDVNGAGGCAVRFCSRFLKSGSWVFWSFLSLIQNLPQLYMHAIIFISCSFFVFCCPRDICQVRVLQQYNKGSQVPVPLNNKTKPGVFPTYLPTLVHCKQQLPKGNSFLTELDTILQEIVCS